MNIKLTAEQAALLKVATIDLSGLAARAKKDEDRIVLFGMATANKQAAYGAMAVAALAAGDSPLAFSIAAEAVVFGKAAAELSAKWVMVGANAWTKISFARLFGWDPFKPLREETRVFAAKWELDSAFRTAMG